MLKIFSAFSHLLDCVADAGTLPAPSEHRDQPASGAEMLMNCRQDPSQ